MKVIPSYRLQIIGLDAAKAAIPIALSLRYPSMIKVAREPVPYNALNNTATLTGHAGSGRIERTVRTDIQCLYRQY
jgi:hypothetical protein